MKPEVILLAYISTIHSVGEVPSGHLYAMVMGEGVSLDDHLATVRVLTRGGLATNVNHCLSLTAAGHDLAAKIDRMVGL